MPFLAYSQCHRAIGHHSRGSQYATPSTFYRFDCCFLLDFNLLFFLSFLLFLFQQSCIRLQSNVRLYKFLTTECMAAIVFVIVYAADTVQSAMWWFSLALTWRCQYLLQLRWGYRQHDLSTLLASLCTMPNMSSLMSVQFNRTYCHFAFFRHRSFKLSFINIHMNFCKRESTQLHGSKLQFRCELCASWRLVNRPLGSYVSCVVGNSTFCIGPHHETDGQRAKRKIEL